MKKILIAAVELSTRFAAEKRAKPTRQVIPAGTHLTPALLKMHGLKDDDVAALLDRGQVVEESAHVVAEGDGPSAADLAAAEKRADVAEARVKELTTELSDANKEGDELAEKLEAETKLLSIAKGLFTTEQSKAFDEAAKKA